MTRQLGPNEDRTVDSIAGHVGLIQIRTTQRNPHQAKTAWSQLGQVSGVNISKRQPWPYPRQDHRIIIKTKHLSPDQNTTAESTSGQVAMVPIRTRQLSRHQDKTVESTSKQDSLVPIRTRRPSRHHDKTART